MDNAVYKQVASEDTELSPQPSSTSPDDRRQSIQFAKAAFVFRDRLDDVRKKKSPMTTIVETPVRTPVEKAAALAAAPPTPQKEEAAAPAEAQDPVTAWRLRILSLVQSTLTAFVSITIAVLQAKAYVIFQQTKDLAAAWPDHPNLLPTLLLMGVAITAGAFDISLLYAYLFPRHSRMAFRIATSSHNALMYIKGVSYGITSIVCKGGFDFGNASGLNNDLWSWTCSPAGEKMDAWTQASANCDGQTAAWYLSLIAVGIEGLGITGKFVITNMLSKGTGKPDPLGDLSPEFEKIESFSDEVHSTLGEVTPKIEAKPAAA